MPARFPGTVLVFGPGRQALLTELTLALMAVGGAFQHRLAISRKVRRALRALGATVVPWKRFAAGSPGPGNTRVCC